jgi:hypothetical protein
MSIRRDIVSIVFALATPVMVMAQDNVDEQEVASLDWRDEQQPLFVLVTKDETYELDPGRYRPFEINTLNSSTIKLITVLAPEEGTTQYGEMAKHGAIVIEFQDDFIFVKEQYLKLPSED